MQSVSLSHIYISLSCIFGLLLFLIFVYRRNHSSRLNFYLFIISFSALKFNYGDLQNYQHLLMRVYDCIDITCAHAIFHSREFLWSNIFYFYSKITASFFYLGAIISIMSILVKFFGLYFISRRRNTDLDELIIWIFPLYFSHFYFVVDFSTLRLSLALSFVFFAACVLLSMKDDVRSLLFDAVVVVLALGMGSLLHVSVIPIGCVILLGILGRVLMADRSGIGMLCLIAGLMVVSYLLGFKNILGLIGKYLVVTEVYFRDELKTITHSGVVSTWLAFGLSSFYIGILVYASAIQEDLKSRPEYWVVLGSCVLSAMFRLGSFDAFLLFSRVSSTFTMMIVFVPVILGLWLRLRVRHWLLIQSPAVALLIHKII